MRRCAKVPLGDRVNDTLVASLNELEVFRGLKDEQLAAIARSAERVVFKPGQSIVKAGEAGDGAFVVVGGDADVIEAANGVVLQPVVPGSLVGEQAMLVEHEYRITVMARTSVRALKLTRSEMHQLMLKDRALTDHFVDRFTSRLTRVAVELKRVDQMLALAAEPAPAHA